MPGFMSVENIVGSVAGILCTVSFIPQVVVIIKTKKTGDISLGTFLIFSIGVTMWLFYGILLKSTPIIIANSATLALALIIVIMKLKHG